MRTLALPVSIVLAALIISATFRYQAFTGVNNALVVYDRWSGKIGICGIQPANAAPKCAAYPDAHTTSHATPRGGGVN